MSVVEFLKSATRPVARIRPSMMTPCGRRWRRRVRGRGTPHRGDGVCSPRGDDLSDRGDVHGSSRSGFVEQSGLGDQGGRWPRLFMPRTILQVLVHRVLRRRSAANASRGRGLGLVPSRARADRAPDVVDRHRIEQGAAEDQAIARAGGSGIDASISDDHDRWWPAQSATCLSRTLLPEPLGDPWTKISRVYLQADVVSTGTPSEALQNFSDVTPTFLRRNDGTAMRVRFGPW